jgi:hypothetical protein
LPLGEVTLSSTTMAHPTPELVVALRRTAARLKDGVRYRWSHFAVCNCGNLAQTITDLSPDAIYEAAMQRPGDWGEQAREYCPTSGLAMDDIVGRILELGMEKEDIRHLERLSHPHVLRAIPEERRPLKHTRREDTVLFMETWADLLEARLDDVGQRRVSALMAEPADAGTADAAA